ncbi:hypothetical protein OS914_14160 [Arthrobacter sp. H14-L1]|nr:hypothetical protein [Arthrobacter sp. H14-L1]MCY0906025.1 hypothetical protein [Arthrobacter sp. H14-L1]
MPFADLAAAHGRYDRQAPVGRTRDEVHEHIQGALIRPLQVIDHQHHWTEQAEFLKPAVNHDRDIVGRAVGCSQRRVHDAIDPRRSAESRSQRKKRDRHRGQRQTGSGEDPCSRCDG